jgi:hypothetical protein
MPVLVRDRWVRDAGFRETILRHLVGTGSNVVWSMVVGIK